MNRIIEAINIVYCTDNINFIDPESHFLHIPKSLFNEFVMNCNFNRTCFEISNITDSNGKKIYLSKIEPSEEEFDKNLLIPNWVCKELNLNDSGSLVRLKQITNPNKIKRIKIKGSNSLYVNLDIKSLLESKIEKFKCLNTGTIFKIDEIIFNIIELISIEDKIVEYGLTTNTLEIEFEIPDDIKLLEKRKYITNKIIDKIEKKIKLENENLEKEILENNKKKISNNKILSFNDFIKNSKENEMKILKNKNSSLNLDLICFELIDELEKSFQSPMTGEQIEIIKQEKKLIEEIIQEGKETQKQMIEEEKKKLLEELEKNTKSNIEKQIESSSNSNIFNSKGYKLTEQESQINSQTKLTREEIINLRLKKLSQKP